MENNLDFRNIKRLLDEKMDLKDNLEYCNSKIYNLEKELNMVKNKRDEKILMIKEIESELSKYKIIKE